MLLKIKDKEFDFNCTLGVTIRIKSTFKKTYNQIISELDKLDTEEMIKLLYCGLTDAQIKESDFLSYLFENCGMADLTDYVSWFVKQIQYPGMSEEDIEKKLLERKQKAELFQL